MDGAPVTVFVNDLEGRPLFIGRPSAGDEYVRIHHVDGQPALLEVRCRDMSALVQRQEKDSAPSDVDQRQRASRNQTEISRAYAREAASTGALPS